MANDYEDVLRWAKRADAENSRMWDRVAAVHFARGEGTGAASKIFSTLGILISTALAVQLVKDDQYIALIVMFALAWTRIGSFVMPAGLIYFLATKYWIGAGMVAVWIVITGASGYFGFRNVKRLLRSRKPMISPFEGMSDLLLVLILECAFLTLALLTGGWLRVLFCVLFGFLAIYHAQRLYFRLRPKWRQIHNPMMIRYAAIAGGESAQSRVENREFDYFRAAQLLLSSAYPSYREEQIEDMVDLADDKLLDFSDRDLIRRTIEKRNPTIPTQDRERALNEVAAHLQTADGRKLIIRYTIAEVVEAVFGESERGEYLAAVFGGDAT